MQNCDLLTIKSVAILLFEILEGQYWSPCKCSLERPLQDAGCDEHFEHMASLEMDYEHEHVQGTV